MTFSLRTVFAAFAFIAFFLAVLLSRSDLFMSVATLLFIGLVLMSIPLAITARRRREYWLGFAALAVGTLVFSSHVTLFDEVASSLAVQLRPPQRFTPLPVSGFSPPTGSAVFPAAKGYVPLIQPSQPVAMPAPVSVYAFPSPYSGSLKQFLVASFALLVGTIGGGVTVWLARAPGGEQDPARLPD